VTEPDVLVAMNQPSLDKFIADVTPGGTVLVDSTMVQRLPERKDVTVFAVPATQLAEDEGLKGLGNVVLVGKLLKELGFCELAALDAAIVKSVPAKRQHLLEPNRRALAIGMEGSTCEM
jgi:2-oxoglutarate ferredoxin oxidoreductase subunit gamma